MMLLNSHDQVAAIKVNESDFHDWDSPFEDLHHRPSRFTVKPHVFSFNHTNPTSVSYLIYDGQPVTMKDLKKVAFPNCDETHKNATPVALPVPGMKDINRIELLWS
jgi:hypothetical protein